MNMKYIKCTYDNRDELIKYFKQFSNSSNFCYNFGVYYRVYNNIIYSKVILNPSIDIRVYNIEDLNIKTNTDEYEIY